MFSDCECDCLSPSSRSHRSINPKLSEPFTLQCQAIVEGANVRIHTTAEQSTLYITDISADDSGKYTAEIMNDYGVEGAAASVAVEGPPEPPSGQPSVSMGPDRVAVAWCGPPYDGGCMITGFMYVKILHYSLNSF